MNVSQSHWSSRFLLVHFGVKSIKSVSLQFVRIESLLSGVEEIFCTPRSSWNGYLTRLSKYRRGSRRKFSFQVAWGSCNSTVTRLLRLVLVSRFPGGDPGVLGTGCREGEGSFGSACCCSSSGTFDRLFDNGHLLSGRWNARLSELHQRNVKRYAANFGLAKNNKSRCMWDVMGRDEKVWAARVDRV